MATRAAAGYRLRPAPRRRARGRGASRVRWDKLGRVILVLVLIAVLASYVGPLINLVGSWQDRNSTASDLSSLRRQNASLHQAVASEKESVSAAARKLGMVGPTERSYYVHGLK